MNGRDKLKAARTDVRVLLDHIQAQEQRIEDLEKAAQAANSLWFKCFAMNLHGREPEVGKAMAELDRALWAALVNQQEDE